MGLERHQPLRSPYSDRVGTAIQLESTMEELAEERFSRLQWKARKGVVVMVGGY